MNSLKALLPSLWKAFKWFGMNTFFGIAPFWITGFLRLMSENEEIQRSIGKEIHNLIHDCALLFVFCALAAAAMLDFMFSKISKDAWAVFGIVMVCLLMLLSVALAYTSIVLDEAMQHGSQTAKDYTNFNIFQCAMIVCSFLFCIMIKTITFKKEEL